MKYGAIQTVSSHREMLSCDADHTPKGTPPPPLFSLLSITMATMMQVTVAAKSTPNPHKGNTCTYALMW